MITTRISIDNIIEIVRSGGCVKTGIDVYDDKGILLLDRNVLVTKAAILERIKQSGINSIPVSSGEESGLWDIDGNSIDLDSDGMVDFEPEEDIQIPDTTPPKSARQSKIEKRLVEIEELKVEAEKKYNKAKKSIKKVLNDIRQTGGEFDYEEVESHVSELVDFLVETDNPFSYLTQELFSYDDYLYNHSVNVCAIATAVINKFNENFSNRIDDYLTGNKPELKSPFEKGPEKAVNTYSCYYKDDLGDISLGFFLHDIGKVMVPEKILNKPSNLTQKEFEEVKKHSYEYGIKILEKNRLRNSFIKSIIKYHHAPLYKNEDRCYPVDKKYNEIPIYTRICKLADIYDAMTSKRCYKEAFNQISVVTELFRRYAKKDVVLQYILHSFVKSIGIYPPGSIIYLKNGQMAYVLESSGPIVLPFTDSNETTLKVKPDPIDIGDSDLNPEQAVDNNRSVRTPKDVFDLLPSFLRKIITNTK